MRTVFVLALLAVVLFRLLPFWSVTGMLGQGSGPRTPGGENGCLATIDALGGFQVVVAAVISLPVLVASLVAVFRREDPDAQKWAFGAIGTLLGFWLGQ